MNETCGLGMAHVTGIGRPAATHPAATGTDSGSSDTGYGCGERGELRPRGERGEFRVQGGQGAAIGENVWIGGDGGELGLRVAARRRAAAAREEKRRGRVRAGRGGGPDRDDQAGPAEDERAERAGPGRDR